MPHSLIASKFLFLVLVLGLSHALMTQHLAFCSTRSLQVSRAIMSAASSKKTCLLLEDFLRHHESREYSWPDETSSSARFPLHFVHEKVVVSTQDLARKLVVEGKRTEDDSESTAKPLLAVLADTQTAGRGTRGRVWHSSLTDDAKLGLINKETVSSSARDRNNMFLTIAVPIGAIPLNPLTLLPLQVGVWVAERIQHVLQHMRSKDLSPPHAQESAVHVKWPNDVLIGSKKVSGTLIESVEDYFLIGIGINVHHHPSDIVDEKTLRRSPRQATSIKHHVGGDDIMLPYDLSLAIAWDLAITIRSWILSPAACTNTGSEVVDLWTSWAQFPTDYQLRNDHCEGEIVTALALASDGQLRVRDKTGRERLLNAEYLV